MSVEIEGAGVNIASHLPAMARRLPDSPAVTLWSGESLTFKELDKIASAFLWVLSKEMRSVIVTHFPRCLPCCRIWRATPRRAPPYRTRQCLLPTPFGAESIETQGEEDAKHHHRRNCRADPQPVPFGFDVPAQQRAGYDRAQ